MLDSSHFLDVDLQKMMKFKFIVFFENAMNLNFILFWRSTFKKCLLSNRFETLGSKNVTVLKVIDFDENRVPAGFIVFR